MRQKGQWLFTKYDAFNRPVMTGVLTSSKSHNNMQSAFKGFGGRHNQLYESRTTSGNVQYSYNESFPTGLEVNETALLSVSYYDDYAFLTEWGLSYKFEEHPSIDVYADTEGNINYFDKVKGQVTGSMVKVLDNKQHIEDEYTWLNSITYYDDHYRSIKTIADVYQKNGLGLSSASFEYDFVGRVKKARTDINFEGDANYVVERYDYDHAGRLLQHHHKINGANEVLLVDNTYNELGELVTKKVGNVQQMDYKYNIRGWLTSINEDKLSGVGGNKKFAMKLGYNIPQSGLSASAQYNGNISSMNWRTEGATGISSNQGAYGFQYDALNRLTNANYGQGASSIARDAAYDMSVGSYDLNGNLDELRRNKGDVLVDNLDYTYVGNQLMKVNDRTDKSLGFSEGSSGGGTYAYDLNGNMVKDGNRGLTNVRYNHLNLPSKLTGDDNKTIRYIYDANGQKVAKTYNDGTGDKTTYYADGFIYEETTLKQIAHAEGHIDNGGRYQYYLKDHLGNTRVMVSADNVTNQINTYYPFGMNAELYNKGTNNKFRYNGKELQTEDVGKGELDWYDYGARFYDPTIGRFFTQDRFAEKYMETSPYHYALNNPILNIDVNGDSVNVASMQAYDKKNGTNYTQTMISDLESQTGLTYTVTSSGQLVYKKDDKGNAIVATKKDGNGNAVQVGSKEARDIMINNVDHKVTAYARITSTRSSAPVNGGLINLNPQQINGFINGAQNVDSRTMGWGMTFMHESLHSALGGGLRDNLPRLSDTGQVVDRLNIVRQELNQNGGNYGVRMSYKATSFNPSGKPAYVPFDRVANSNLMLGVKPAIVNKHIIIK
jgi:RHS repeat-associated protein